MFQITQFKPALYALLLLGMAGFALASSSPLALILGCGGVAVNGWLVMTGRFRPVPRPIANLITIASMIVVARQLLALREGRFAQSDPLGNPVLIIGHFLVVLQLVKLWEQRLNRDYGQLLVLGLLQMVAASINTNRLAFGGLFIGYLLVSLYCCLLFHLKVEGDRARVRAGQVRARAAGRAIPPQARRKRQSSESLYPEFEPPLIPLSRPAQKGLNAAMRKLAAVVAVFAVVSAILTFLLFPRGPGSGVLAQAQLPLGQPQTGYSDSVSFSQIAPLLTDERIVAHAKVTRNDRALGAGDSLYLRGATNSRYRAQGQDSRRDYTGVFVGPSFPTARTELPPIAQELRQYIHETDGPEGARADVYRLNMSITGPIGAKDLFTVSSTLGGGNAVAQPRWFESRSHLELRMAGDGTLRSPDLPNGQFEYDMTTSTRPLVLDLFEPTTVPDPASSAASPIPALRVKTSFHTLRPNQYIIRVADRPIGELPEALRQMIVAEAYIGGHKLTLYPGGRGDSLYRGGPTVPQPEHIPAVQAYARRPEVSGEDVSGQPLAAQRNRASFVDPLDAQIAGNIERHLRSTFSYSMDVTGSRTSDKDPIVWFLSDEGKRGHCEYFAWAMTLLCQELGLNARVALGFRCDEFNPFSQQFIVRQSHAHAWVEVLTVEGWRTFDPTSGRGDETQTQEYGVLQQLRHMFDWLESAYANNVIYYNNENRESLLHSAEMQITKPLYSGVNKGWITAKFSDSKLYQALADPGGGAIVSIAILLALAGGYWWIRRLLRRWALRQRVERIGLASLPVEERLRLARQLGFYDDLLQLLERRTLTREPHQTPMEFAQSLFLLPADAYETVHRLTEIYYRIRYGGETLSDGLQRRVRQTVKKLDATLTHV